MGWNHRDRHFLVKIIKAKPWRERVPHLTAPRGGGRGGLGRIFCHLIVSGGGGKRRLGRNRVPHLTTLAGGEKRI